MILNLLFSIMKKGKWKQKMKLIYLRENNFILKKLDLEGHVVFISYHLYINELKQYMILF